MQIRISDQFYLNSYPYTVTYKLCFEFDCNKIHLTEFLTPYENYICLRITGVYFI